MGAAARKTSPLSSSKPRSGARVRSGGARVRFPTPQVAEDDPALLAFVKDLAVYCAERYLAGHPPGGRTPEDS